MSLSLIPRLAVYLLLLAQPNPLATRPTQVRIAYGDDPRHSVRIVWQTQAATATEVVEYGTSESLGQIARGKRASYAYETGVLHEAALTSLEPGTTYHYRVGDFAGGYSRIYSFRTAPDKPEDFTFTAFGDHGVTEAAARNVENVLREKPAFHLLLGDISYANGDQPVWDAYFTQIEPMACRIPVMPTLGNHENERIGPERKRIGYVSYLARFALPGAETHYTFDYGAARFVAFNSDDVENKEQLAWLDKTLATARQDRKVRWLIVYQHHPLFGSTQRRGDNQALIAALQPLYDKYQVDLVLQGHDHVYERQYPLRNSQAVSASLQVYPQGQGTVYVICGGGGKSLYQFTPEKPALCAVREQTYCYLKVHVPQKGALVVEARRLDGSRIERFEIQPTL
ncbi:MAG TPA: metallophosphoesterase family protein [Chthonomonadaceae bacterium]|nr:metallophosphoesterase family protein [Chthonomonadaceae bacterium]